MEKPIPENFGVTISDVEVARRTEEKIPVVLFVLSAIGWSIYAIASGEFKFNPFLIFLALLLGGTLSLLTTALALFPVEFAVKTLNRTYRKAKEFEKANLTYQAWWVRAQSDFWTSLTGIQFEHELANLYRKLGFRAEVTKSSNDKGVDIWLEDGQRKYIVQCKAHKKAIGPSAVRELYGTLKHFGATKAVLASTSGFTKGSIEAASNKPIQLLGLSEIIHMQKQMEN